MSTGIRGLRFGVNPRGQQYIQCGRHGIYYRKTFGNASRTNNSSISPGSPQFSAPILSPTGAIGPQQTISSGNISAMQNSSAADLLTEIVTRHNRIRLHRWFFVLIMAIAITAAIQGMNELAEYLIFFGLVGVPAFWLIDRARKTVRLIYELDSDHRIRFERLQIAFDLFRSSKRIWVILSAAAIRDAKYYSGAQSLLGRKQISPSRALPAYFKCNIRPPMIQTSRLRFFFFPDTILVFDGNQIGSLTYDQLQVDSDTTSFIESQSPPSDAIRAGQTWRYVNKNGAPDRRFSGNYAVPIMRYGLMRFRSAGRLNEEFHVSLLTAVPALASALHEMGLLQNATQNSISPPQFHSNRTPWPEV